MTEPVNPAGTPDPQLTGGITPHSDVLCKQSAEKNPKKRRGVRNTAILAQRLEVRDVAERTTERTTATVNLQQAALGAYARVGVLQAAADAAGVHRGTIGRWLAEDAAFGAAWTAAGREAADRLELEAIRRAVEGEREPQLYRGEHVRIPDPDSTQAWSKRKKVPVYRHKRSDSILLRLLARFKPEEYARKVDHRHLHVDLGATAGPLPTWFASHPNAVPVVHPQITQHSPPTPLPAEVLQGLSDLAESSRQATTD